MHGDGPADAASPPFAAVAEGPVPADAPGVSASTGPTPPSGGDPSGAAGSVERPGHQVVLALFVILGLCVVSIFTVFGLAVRPEDRGWVPELTARYLYMPVVATSIIVAIDAYRLDRRRWWVFLVTAPVPVVNVILAAMWLLRWRRKA